MAERIKPATNLVEYTVSELAFALKRTVEDAYGQVRLRGEISGYKGPHSSGHCDFTLKDEKATIEAVIWRGTFSKLSLNLSFEKVPRQMTASMVAFSSFRVKSQW